MKKILFMMLGVLIALPAFARDFTYEYGGQTLTYTVLDENAKTCKTKNGSYQSSSFQPGNEVSGNLVLPANPKDGEVEYTLTTIGTYAFSLCSGLTSVSIPNTVTSIGYAAFYKCSGLTSVNIPNSVTSIGEYAFSDCSGLKTLIIEDGDTELNVGNGAFKYSPIENLTIGRNWTYGGRDAMTTSIKNLTLTNGVTVIPKYAFHNCSNLLMLSIGNNITSVDASYFEGCNNLSSLTIADGPNPIELSGDWKNFTNLENLTINRNFTITK